MTQKVIQLSFKRYVQSLNSAYGFVGSIGVLIPIASTFFTSFAPPPREFSAPMAAASAVATLIATYYYTPQKSKRRRRATKLPPLVSRGLWVLALSVLMLLLYTRALGLVTVVSGSGTRYQIGFYTSKFGLTEEGLAVRATHPSATPYEWMMNDALFYSEGPPRLWHWWARDLSSIIITSFFVLAFALWAHGWALLAKQRALDERESSVPQRA